MNTIISIEILFILTLAIPIIFKIKNWLYKKQNLDIKKSEETIFLAIMYLGLFMYGFAMSNEFAMLVSIPFLFWLLVPIFKWWLGLWQIFINLLKNVR